MSVIFRRYLSTIVPPKVASAAAIKEAPSAQRTINVVNFYKALPRVSEPSTIPKHKGPIGWYKSKYFDGDNASAAPILHVIFFLATVGYTFEYVTHFRHHKGGHAEEAH